jgi:hypothetical protein
LGRDAVQTYCLRARYGFRKLPAWRFFAFFGVGKLPNPAVTAQCLSGLLVSLNCFIWMQIMEPSPSLESVKSGERESRPGTPRSLGFHSSTTLAAEEREASQRQTSRDRREGIGPRTGQMMR